MAASPIVVLGAGSPLVPDLEESCARAGVPIAAIVSDPGGEDFALDRTLLRADDTLAPPVRALPTLTPLFAPGARLRAYRTLEAARGAPVTKATVLDPTAALPRSARFGPGTYVNAGVVVGAGSFFGEGCLLNRGCCVGHHVEVGDYVSIGPAAAIQGDVKIGRGAVIGINATVLTWVTIGANAVVGAGSVVTRDVPANTVVWGSPARIQREGIAGFGDLGVEP